MEFLGFLVGGLFFYYADLPGFWKVKDLVSGIVAFNLYYSVCLLFLSSVTPAKVR